MHSLIEHALFFLFVLFAFFFPCFFFPNSLEASCQMSHRFYLFVSTLIWLADCSRNGVTVLVLFIKGLLDAWVHFCWLATTTDLIWASHLLFSCGTYVSGEFNSSFLTPQITFHKSVIVPNPLELRYIGLFNFKGGFQLRNLRHSVHPFTPINNVYMHKVSDSGAQCSLHGKQIITWHCIS